jgi:two-component system, NtrC family, nitrogen regulation sensor histidine kinase NtrY
MRNKQRQRFSLVTRFSLSGGAIIVCAVSLQLGLTHLTNLSAWQCALITVGITIPLVVIVIRAQLKPILQMFNALNGTVSSYKDADFSFSLHWPHHDEIGELVASHNALGDVLRSQRLDLVQRELLLDTMVQHTPVAMLLISESGPIVYANLAARQLLNNGRKLEGHTLNDVLANAHSALKEAVDKQGDGLFTLTQHGEDEDEVYHLARRFFTLNARHHELLMLRHLSPELRRAEVQTWKKVIRVISHELNNSLAPVASLAHSGAQLLQRGKPERLIEILDAIAERTRHLEGFIQGYARFAKLPNPQPTWVAWPSFIARLKLNANFESEDTLVEKNVYVDVPQLEQALINLLKNAHESGSPDGAIFIRASTVRNDDSTTFAGQRLNNRASHTNRALRIDVEDRGSGMTETVLTHALMPFYSTKRSGTVAGTGLGLALAREIVEAHGGHISLHNREGGGLVVSLVLPMPVHQLAPTLFPMSP